MTPSPKDRAVGAFEAARTAMCRKDVTFANCDANWQMDAIKAVIAAYLTTPQNQDVVHPIGANHPDGLAVDRFAAAMKAKLARKRAEGFGGWDDPEQCHIDYLHHLLHVQFHERTVIDPVDIANIAMMIHERSPSDD